VQDAFFSNDNPGTSGTVMGLTSFSDACATLYTSKRVPRSSVAMSFQLITLADGSLSGPVTAPGTFSLLTAGVSTGEFGVNWDTIDASCNDTSTSATGGSVTVTAVSASRLEGTFDLTFGADHVTGSFSASNCAATATSQGDPICS